MDISSYADSEGPDQTAHAQSYLGLRCPLAVSADMTDSKSQCVDAHALLIFIKLWANSADDKLVMFFIIFPWKKGLGISCKLPYKETIFHEISKPILGDDLHEK